MNNLDSKKQRTTVYLPIDILILLKKAAEERDRSLTKQIERVLKEWLIQKGYLANQ